MYYVTAYVIYIALTIGLLFFNLICRSRFTLKIKKILTGIIGLCILSFYIACISFLPFHWKNIVFAVLVLFSYILIVGLIYFIVSKVYSFFKKDTKEQAKPVIKISAIGAKKEQKAPKEKKNLAKKTEPSTQANKLKDKPLQKTIKAQKKKQEAKVIPTVKAQKKEKTAPVATVATTPKPKKVKTDSLESMRMSEKLEKARKAKAKAPNLDAYAPQGPLVSKVQKPKAIKAKKKKK